MFLIASDFLLKETQAQFSDQPEKMNPRKVSCGLAGWIQLLGSAPDAKQLTVGMVFSPAVWNNVLVCLSFYVLSAVIWSALMRSEELTLNIFTATAKPSPYGYSWAKPTDPFLSSVVFADMTRQDAYQDIIKS